MASDEDGIRRTLANFCQYLDSRRFGEWSELFADDGVFQHVQGKEQILAFIRTQELAEMPDLTRKHVSVNLVIDITGTEAQVVSDLVLLDRYPGADWEIRLGIYTDKLACVGGRWLFTNRQLEWTANPLTVDVARAAGQL